MDGDLAAGRTGVPGRELKRNLVKNLRYGVSNRPGSSDDDLPSILFGWRWAIRDHQTV